MMVKQAYTVRFITPAFLGDAEQNGTWRTPPFKALLRQWWRISAAKQYNYNGQDLRKKEGQLFGNAWLDNNFQRSKVRIRLEEWRQGKMQTWREPEKKVNHPEVKFPVDAQLYLGYGPLTYDKATKKAGLKINAAIQADESNSLSIAHSHSNETTDVLTRTLLFIHWFGTLGSRSRNGWGSLALEGQDIKPLTRDHASLQAITRPLSDCLELDWPHAIGKDKKGLLIWRTPEHTNWQEVMKQLAKIKIAFRTALHFDPARLNHIDQRHVIAYPVTHHNFNPWGNQARLANQLRFKVSKTTQGYVGMAYHLPCSIPNELLDKLNPADRTWITGQQLTVWQTVHGILDQQMQRI